MGPLVLHFEDLLRKIMHGFYKLEKIKLGALEKWWLILMMFLNKLGSVNRNDDDIRLLDN